MRFIGPPLNSLYPCWNRLEDLGWAASALKLQIWLLCLSACWNAPYQYHHLFFFCLMPLSRHNWSCSTASDIQETWVMSFLTKIIITAVSYIGTLKQKSSLHLQVCLPAGMFFSSGISSANICHSFIWALSAIWEMSALSHTAPGPSLHLVLYLSSHLCWMQYCKFPFLGKALFSISVCFLLPF